MSNLRRLFALITVALVTSSAASGETQKWCQSADLTPSHDPTKWITHKDFPTHFDYDSQKAWDNTGIYRIFVGADGRTKQCTILASTTAKNLDLAACSNLKRRARFNQLDDINCADVVRIYDYKARFIIPNDGNDPQVTSSKV